MTHAEEWRPCPGFEGAYSVSDLGRVRRDLTRGSGKSGHIMRPIAVDDYHYVKLCNGPIRKRFSVHSLIARAFHGVCPQGREVNHKNAIKGDNRSENLEYVTRAENCQHAARLGLIKGNGFRGEACPSAKLTEEKVRGIVLARDGGASISGLSRAHGVTYQTIRNILTGRTWAHVTERVS